MRLSEAQKHVIRQGYCVLHLVTRRWTCSGLTYWEWSQMIDAAYLRHEKSRLHPDDDPKVCWERYRVTDKGRAALDGETG